MLYLLEPNFSLPPCGEHCQTEFTQGAQGEVESHHKLGGSEGTGVNLFHPHFHHRVGYKGLAVIRGERGEGSGVDLFHPQFCHMICWEGLVVVMRSGEEGTRVDNFHPPFCCRVHQGRGWQSWKGGHCSVSDKFSIEKVCYHQVWSLIGSVSDRFGF